MCLANLSVCLTNNNITMRNNTKNQHEVFVLFNHKYPEMPKNQSVVSKI